MNRHVKYSGVMTTIKSGGFYFFRAYDSLIKVIMFRVTEMIVILVTLGVNLRTMVIPIIFIGF
jgi:hypothetical protein